MYSNLHASLMSIFPQTEHLPHKPVCGMAASKFGTFSGLRDGCIKMCQFGTFFFNFLS